MKSRVRVSRVTLVALVLASGVAVTASTAAAPGSPVPALSVVELEATLKAGVPVIVEFGGEHCIPCMQMQPVLRDLQALLGKRARVVNFWIQAHPEVARQHRIMVMPTQVIFDARGQEVFRHIGLFPKSEFERVLKEKGIL